MRARLAIVALALLPVGAATGQVTEFSWAPDQETVLSDSPFGTDELPPYAPGFQLGARGVEGPCDLDNDGRTDLLVTDYSGGGRVYVIEAAGPDTWELVYAQPSLDSTAHSENVRFAACGDLDNDGWGEIITLSGRGYSPGNPLTNYAPPGLHVTEADGDNSFLELPTAVYTFPEGLPDRWASEKIVVKDVDGDGMQEVLFANSGGAGFDHFDNWYVLSISSQSGFAQWELEARWSTRDLEDFDPFYRGGGSAYSIIPADLDGDGSFELALSSWYNLNFTNVDVAGPDTYVADTTGQAWYHASGFDEVARYGCIAVDMDENGDDEVFCPVYDDNRFSGNVTLVNYEPGEDVRQIDSSNVVYGILPGFSARGLAAGDIDGDGAIELIGSGESYQPEDYAASEPPLWLRVADFSSDPGRDVEDPAYYSVRDIAFPGGGGGFNTLVDSTGTHLAIGNYGQETVAKIAFLGDADDDGHMEVAMSMQRVQDSLYYIVETYPTDSTSVRTIVPDSTKAYTNRAFLRIFSGRGMSTNITEDRIVLPQDYVLEPNYPNPFNPSTTFSFTLPIDKRVSVLIYDVTGRLIRTLIDEESYVQGTHSVTWNGVDDARMPVASGQYFYVLRYGNFQQARPMSLIK